MYDIELLLKELQNKFHISELVNTDHYKKHKELNENDIASLSIFYLHQIIDYFMYNWTLFINSIYLACMN